MRVRSAAALALSTASLSSPHHAAFAQDAPDPIDPQDVDGYVYIPNEQRISPDPTGVCGDQFNNFYPGVRYQSSDNYSSGPASCGRWCQARDDDKTNDGASTSYYVGFSYHHSYQYCTCLYETGHLPSTSRADWYTSDTWFDYVDSIFAGTTYGAGPISTDWARSVTSRSTWDFNRRGGFPPWKPNPLNGNYGDERDVAFCYRKLAFRERGQHCLRNDDCKSGNVCFNASPFSLTNPASSYGPTNDEKVCMPSPCSSSTNGQDTCTQQLFFTECDADATPSRCKFNCVSGETGVFRVEDGGETATTAADDAQTNENEEGSKKKKKVAAIKTLKVGDAIAGLDADRAESVCEVVAVPFMGRGVTYGNYTRDHYMLSSSSSSSSSSSGSSSSASLSMHGREGDKEMADTYQVLTTCPLGVDESGKTLTFSACTPDDGSDMGWADYLAVHTAFLRIVRATSLRDMTALGGDGSWKKAMPALCREGLTCLRGSSGSTCDGFEAVMASFVDEHLAEDAKAKAMNAFPALGVAGVVGSVSDVVTAGRSTAAAKAAKAAQFLLRGASGGSDAAAVSDGFDQRCIVLGSHDQVECEGSTAADGTGCRWCNRDKEGAVTMCLSQGEAEVALAEGWASSCEGGAFDPDRDVVDRSCLDAPFDCESATDVNGIGCSRCTGGSSGLPDLCVSVSQKDIVAMIGYDCE